jgi:hypothetical protein
MKLLLLTLTLCFHSLLFSQVATIELWKDSVIGALYNPETASAVYGKKDQNGYYKIFISDSLGNDEVPLTYPGWRSDRHHWAEEWHPSGNYLFCIIEKDEYVKEKKGHKRAPVDATPGYGAYCDLWLVTRDGSKAWKLTDLPNSYNSGIIHCAISDDGTLFGWSERVGAPKFGDMNLAAGSYVFRIADFSLPESMGGTATDSIPKFSNIRTFQPGNVAALNELESFSKDNKTIAFYSTFESKHLFRTPIYTMHLETGEIKKLTTESFAQAPHFTPDGKRLVYMTGHECVIFPFEIQGADWWVMNADGTEKKRISYMNVKDHVHSFNHYRLCGSLSFISNNSFLGGVMIKPLGLTGYTVKVTFYE